MEIGRNLFGITLQTLFRALIFSLRSSCLNVTIKIFGPHAYAVIEVNVNNIKDNHCNPHYFLFCYAR